MYLYYAKAIFIEVIGPLIFLAILATCLPEGIRGSVAAWKSKNKKLMWLYSWYALVFIYFFARMIK